jgi:transposase, IS30 family
MTYRQITSGERYTLSGLLRQGATQAEAARKLGRHPSSISRELRRNACADGGYRPYKASKRTRGRRSRSRRNARFEREDVQLVEHWLTTEQWSPEQISGELRRQGVLKISHETIYRHVWRDMKNGGLLHKHLRQAPKRRRKRYRSYDSRGWLAGKKMITERSPAVAARQEVGHWEMDTVAGHGSKDCIISLVERVTGYLLIGKLSDRTTQTTNQRAIQLIRSHSAWFKTITADNGTEFHGYQKIEEATGAQIYFATPYHSWERGTNENTNGLIRQYLPKRKSMHRLTQQDCDAIADKLNTRPRKRHGYLSPMEKLCAA